MSSRFESDPEEQARSHLAAIAQEMRASPDGRRMSSHRTIKELLIDLVGLMQKAHHEKRRDGWTEKLQEKSALLVFGVLCAVTMLAANSRSSDFSWLDDHRAFFRTLSIGMSAVYVGVAIERMGIVAVIWRYQIAKFVASLAVSVLVVYSAGRASSIINGIFAIDAGAFPYSRAMLAGWIAFSMAVKPLLWLVGVFAVGHGGAIAMWFFQPQKVGGPLSSIKPGFPWQSVLVIILSLIVLGNAYGWFYRSLSEDQLPAKVYQLARTLDFNARHACVNLPEKAPVIYIGPDQRRVLVDERLDPVLTFGEFVNSPVQAEDNPPEVFKVQDCLMVRPGGP